jgi:hypothetical protein
MINFIMWCLVIAISYAATRIVFQNFIIPDLRKAVEVLNVSRKKQVIDDNDKREYNI